MALESDVENVENLGAEKSLAIDRERMRKLAAEYGIVLEPPLLAGLDKYAALLLDWNTRINLTAITVPEEIESKHFLDSLLFAAQPEVGGELVDVGSGAGFPGMVAALYKPSLRVTLMEPTGKRVKFLQEAATCLDLPMEIVKERAEEAARKNWRERYAVATARAVAALPELCEYCLPLVRVGGFFIAMKGEAEAEVAAAHRAIEKLGGKLQEVRSFTLPDGARRSLVFIQKESPTPPVYPRNGGKIAKSPL